MNWSKDKSILLSQACVIVFAALLLVLDIGGYWFSRGLAAGPLGVSRQYVLLFLITVYLGSIFAWVTLWKLWRLLGNIKKGLVFIPDNVRSMRIVSWCCAGVAVLCLAAAAVLLPYFYLVTGIAAGFMALIVRIVKNAFQQAVAMKSELDLTI